MADTNAIIEDNEQNVGEYDPNPYDNVTVEEALKQLFNRFTPRTVRQAIFAMAENNKPATLVEKSITENGEYAASADNADGYSSVTVDVPGGIEFKSTPAAFTLLENIENLHVIVPEGVTSLAINAFNNNIYMGPSYYCTGLKSLTLPSTLIEIGDYSLEGCSGLTEITIPSSVTTIGIRAFASCTGLTEITIPSSVTSIGSNCFNGCTNLETITIHKAKGSISGAPWAAPNATVVWDG